MKKYKAREEQMKRMHELALASEWLRRMGEDRSPEVQARLIALQYDIDTVVIEHYRSYNDDKAEELFEEFATSQADERSAIVNGEDNG
jgi:hypothetical protein